MAASASAITAITSVLANIFETFKQHGGAALLTGRRRARDILKFETKTLLGVVGYRARTTRLFLCPSNPGKHFVGLCAGTDSVKTGGVLPPHSSLLRSAPRRRAERNGDAHTNPVFIHGFASFALPTAPDSQYRGKRDGNPNNARRYALT